MTITEQFFFFCNYMLIQQQMDYFQYTKDCVYFILFDYNFFLDLPILYNKFYQF